MDWQLCCQSLFLGGDDIRVVAPVCRSSWVVRIWIVWYSIYVFRSNISDYVFLRDYVSCFEEIVWRDVGIRDFYIVIFDSQGISDLLLESRQRWLDQRCRRELACFLGQQCRFLSETMMLLLWEMFWNQREMWCCDFWEVANRIRMWNYLKKKSLCLELWLWKMILVL